VLSNVNCSFPKLTLYLALVVFGVVLLLLPVRGMEVFAQQPTVSIPTVTGTPPGPMATVYGNLAQVTVLSGPGQNFPAVGILVANQVVPAYGATFGGDWVQIGYQGVEGGKGWIYHTFVSVDKPLPLVTPPVTPTPRVTPTLDPTLASRFLAEVTPTPLPTYTLPPPVIVPTYVDQANPLTGGNIPMGFLIIGLAVVGFFGTFLSLLRGR
jgi:hypothetical protein